MRRDIVLALLEQHRETLRELGVCSLSLFGSIARDQAHLDSDIDILVDLEPPLTFDRYMDIKFYLEDHLGARVDLVSWRSLKPQIRDAVEREAIHVA
jgi:predicted nucleotidyltransferase